MPKEIAELQRSENNKELGEGEGGSMRKLMRETGKIRVVRKTNEKESNPGIK